MNPEDKIAEADRYLAQAADLLRDKLNLEAGRSRGAICEQLWRTRKMRGEFGQYFSQSGQDWFVDQLLGQARGGVFVDVGGYDGVTGSNSLFFEMMRGWSGLLVEATPRQIEKARQIRRCDCVETVVAGKASRVEFVEIDAGYLQMSGRLDSYDAATLEKVRAHPDHQERVRTVATRPLARILDDIGICEVDYLSLDVEGSELDILTGFPFDQVPIRVITVENGAGGSDLHRVLERHGFHLIEFLGVDEVYCASDLIHGQRPATMS